MLEYAKKNHATIFLNWFKIMSCDAEFFWIFKDFYIARVIAFEGIKKFIKLLDSIKSTSPFF